jgi:hypothetical protein
MWKFVGGPLAGLAAGLSILETSILTAAGMMTTVVILTYSGERVRKIFRSRKKKEKRSSHYPNTRWVKVWNTYGVRGIAFLTPLILTPIGGTLILIANRVPKKDIIIFMAISAILWALFQTIFFKYFYDGVSSWFSSS